jgi:hypothetical protein
MRKLFCLLLFLSIIGTGHADAQFATLFRVIKKGFSKSTVKSTGKTTVKTISKSSDEIIEYGGKSASKIKKTSRASRFTTKTISKNTDDLFRASKTLSRKSIKSTDEIFSEGRYALKGRSSKKEIDDIFKKYGRRKKPSTSLLKPLHISWADANHFKLIKRQRGFDIISKDGHNLGHVLTNGKTTVVNTYSLTARKAVNPLLDVKPIPNSIYKVENNIFKVDKYGRTVEASASSFPRNTLNRKEIIGSRENAKAMKKQGIKGVDDGGHLIAHSLGGNTGALNIVPMESSLNRVRYYSVERFLKNNSKTSKNYKVEVIYRNKRKQRPKKFIQSFEYRGLEKNLDKLTKVNKRFKYKKMNDASGHEYFKCSVIHKNK